MSASIDSARRHSFRPGLAQSLATVLLFPLLCGLGLWQLQRAAEKEQLFAAIASAQRAVPQPIATLAPSPLPQHAHASGRYDPHLFLLDNRVRNGRAGYEMLAPLRLADGRAVLVDRGWVAQGKDRAHLPPLALPAEPAQIAGVALAPTTPPFALTPEENLANGWPKVVQGVVPAQLAAALGYPLLPLVLYPDGSAAAQHEVAALQNFPPLRHRAYAIQWFALAAVLLLFYLRHGLRSRRAS